MPSPQKVCCLMLFVRVRVLKINLPKLFWFELSDLLITLYDETQCRELAWSVTNYALFVRNVIPYCKCLETSK